VFDLYKLEEDEVKSVLDSLEPPEEEKGDIMAKFRKEQSSTASNRVIKDNKLSCWLS